MNPVDQRAIRWVKWLSPELITQLAMGPVSETSPVNCHCRVCIALEHTVLKNDDYWLSYDAARMLGLRARPPKMTKSDCAAVELWNWHHCYYLSDGGKRFDYGNGPEGYRRCLVIYRAAGWTGTTEGPRLPGGGAGDACIRR